MISMIANIYYYVLGMVQSSHYSLILKINYLLELLLSGLIYKETRKVYQLSLGLYNN